MYISPDNLLKVLQLRKSAISSFKERRIGEIYEGKRKKRKFSLKSLRFVPRYETEDAIWKAVRRDPNYSVVLKVSDEALDLVNMIYEIVYLPKKDSEFIFMSNQEILDYNLSPYKRYFVDGFIKG